MDTGRSRTATFARRLLSWSVGALTSSLIATGCVGPPKSSTAAAPTTVFNIDLTVSTVSGLPACTAAIAGTTAFVQMPPGLWSCNAGAWTQIPCSKLLAGAVAYASATQTLYACVSGVWTQVSLPNGPQGPQGDAGPAGPPGAPGTLLAIKPEPAGANCVAGGQRIDVGADSNRNGTLDAAEIQNTAYVCNGTAGPQGPAGMNGVSTLVASTAEPPGANCANGGVKLAFGADANGNGVIDSGEGTSTSYVCNGVPGAQGPSGMNGLSTIVDSTPEPAGANCVAGGVKLSFGLDSNRNGVLDTMELTATSYVCNGAAGNGGGGTGGSSGTGGSAATGGSGTAGDAADAMPDTSQPDGSTCVPTQEDCFNSLDDDCDNLVDCADPDCNPTAECVPVTGGNNVRGSAGTHITGGATACPVMAPTATQLRGGLSAGGCNGCNCDASSVVCETSVFSYAIDIECSMDTTNTGGTALGTFLSNNQQCTSTPIYDGQLQGLRVSAFTVRTPCGAGGTATTDPPTWTQQASFCAVTQVGGGCGNDSVCKPRFTGGESTCALIPGDTACPTGMNKVTPSANEMPWHTSFTDTRSCSPCGCTTSCESLSVGVGNDWLCTDDVILSSGERQCFGGYSPPVRFVGAPSCSASSTVSGGVSLNGPHTVCCRP